MPLSPVPATLPHIRFIDTKHQTHEHSGTIGDDITMDFVESPTEDIPPPDFQTVPSIDIESAKYTTNEQEQRTTRNDQHQSSFSLGDRVHPGPASSRSRTLSISGAQRDLASMSFMCASGPPTMIMPSDTEVDDDDYSDDGMYFLPRR